MTKAMKAIKITEQAHYQLRIMSVKDDAHIWELVDEAVVLLGRERAKKWRMVDRSNHRTARKEK